MASFYLSAEAAASRLRKLVSRLAAEAVWLDSAGVTWYPESDYWRVPQHIRNEVNKELFS
jgi:hypothetical protein